MSLAALSSQLRQKDSDKTIILNAMKDLNSLKAEKVAGQLRFTVTSVSGSDMVGCSVHIKIAPADACANSTKLTDLEIGSEVELKLTTKSVTVEISCLPANSFQSCTASFELNDAPDNNSMSTQLEAVSESGATCDIHVKATYDTIDGLLESKNVELTEVEGDIKRIAEELRSASLKQNAPAKAKKGSKSQQQAKQREEEREVTAEFGRDDDDSAKGSILQTISSGLFTGLGVLMQHKAVVAFGIATYAIYAHGDAVSV